MSAAKLLLPLALFVASPVLAQSGAAAGMTGMTSSRSLTGETGHGVGVIKRLDLARGTLTLHHGPIAAFGWPAMTMTFAARPPALLKGLRVGQSIAFDARRDGGSAQITAIRQP